MKIVCLGDSLTYGFGVPRHRTWPALAAESTGAEIVNAGITGDTTGGMLARFHADVAARSPQLVLIMGGNNDIFFSGSSLQTRCNITAIVHQAQSKNILPLIGIPPAAAGLNCRWASLQHPAAGRELACYIEWLFEFCRIFRIHIVNFRKDFTHAQALASQPLHLADGQHVNVQGHQVMARTFERALRDFEKACSQ